MRNIRRRDKYLKVVDYEVFVYRQEREVSKVQKIGNVQFPAASHEYANTVAYRVS